MDMQNYFNLDQTLIADLAGSAVILIALNIIIFVYIANRLNFSNTITLTIIGIYILLMATLNGLIMLASIPILIIGLIYAWRINKLSQE